MFTCQAAATSLNTGKSSGTYEGSSAAAAVGAADNDTEFDLPPKLRSHGQVATDLGRDRPGGASDVSGSGGVSQPPAVEAARPGSEVRLTRATIRIHWWSLYCAG